MSRIFSLRSEALQVLQPKAHDPLSGAWKLGLAAAAPVAAAGLLRGEPIVGAFRGLGIFVAVSGLSMQTAHASAQHRNEMRETWALTGSLLEHEPWPSPGGWALGAPALNYLLRQIPPASDQVVVELGPGTSSIVLGRARPGLEIHGVESDAGFYEVVQTALARHGVTNCVLHLAPLVPQSTPEEGEVWYDQDVLRQLPSSFDILLVDGPPNLQGRNNRHGAKKHLLERVRPGGLVLIDDSARESERRLAHSWATHPDFSVAWKDDSFYALRRQK